MHDDFYQMYLEEMKAITPCTQEENTQLLNDAAAGDEGARKRLIEGNLEAALTCAKAYDGKRVLLTDLVAEANMALTMAVTEFLTNPGDGDFEGFLTARMKEALDLAVEEEESAEQTGEELAARVNVLQTVSQALARELGREATVEELDEVKDIMKMAMDAMSMNAENADLEELAEVEGIEITEAAEDEEE